MCRVILQNSAQLRRVELGTKVIPLCEENHNKMDGEKEETNYFYVRKRESWPGLNECLGGMTLHMEGGTVTPVFCFCFFFIAALLLLLSVLLLEPLSEILVFLMLLKTSSI